MILHTHFFSPFLVSPPSVMLNEVTSNAKTAPAFPSPTSHLIHPNKCHSEDPEFGAGTSSGNFYIGLTYHPAKTALNLPAASTYLRRSAPLNDPRGANVITPFFLSFRLRPESRLIIKNTYRPRRSGTPTFGSPPNQTTQRPVTPVIIQIPITYRATNVAILLRTLFILANNAGRTTRQAAFVRTGLTFLVILDTVHLTIITRLDGPKSEHVSV